MLKSFAATFGFLILGSAGVQAQNRSCDVPTFQTADHQTVEGRMMVKTGKNCIVRMGVSVGGFADAEILKQPKRGSTLIRGYDIVYTPRKDFVGADEFTYVRNSIDRYGNKAPRTVNMKVEVLP
jgi:hypothetical protein